MGRDMYFKTDETRMFLLGILTYLVIDILIGIIIAWYFNGGILLAGLVILLFQIIIPIVLLLRSLLYWLFFYIVIKKDISDAFYNELISNKFPEPRDVENSVTEYFDYVASQNVINKKALLLSMFYIGYIKCLNDTWQFISASNMNNGLESAILRYKYYLITKKDSEDTKKEDTKKIEEQ